MLKELEKKALKQAKEAVFEFHDTTEIGEIAVLEEQIEKSLQTLVSNFNIFNNHMEKYHKICQRANNELKEMGDVELLSSKIKEGIEELVARRKPSS